jgi:2-oxoglutarate ferredoxin oxidoreductase subunit delta
MSEATESKPKKVVGTVHIDRERCKGCGFCVEYCPTDALQLESGYNAKGYHPPFLAHADKCTGCDLCGLYCPDFSIYGVMIKNSKVA